MKKEESGNHQYTLKTAQQQAFLEIFNIHAQGGKINKQGLADIFHRIGFKVTEQNFEHICEKAFGSKPQITFEEFMETFKVKESSFDLIDIKNSFRLIAGDSNEKISVDELEELFVKNGIEEERVKEMMVVLSTYIEGGMFNFKLFLSHLS